MMSEMDQLTKELMSDPHVFADAFNLLLYDGNPMIRPEKLTLNHGIYDLESSENKSGQLLAKDEQAGIDDVMFGASSTPKGHQEHAFVESSEVLLLPDAPTHLHEIVDVEDEHLLRYIPNYFINLLDPHCIPVEKIDKLQSELGAIYACYHAEKAQTIAQFIESDQRFDNISNVACRIINHLFTFEIAPVSHESEENMNLNKYIQERYQQEYDKGYKAAQDKEAEHTLRLIKTHEESLRAVIADNTQKLDDAKREADDAKREADDAKREADDAKREADDAKREADDAKREADDAKRSQLEAIKRLKQRGMTCGDIADIMGVSAAEIEKLVCPCFS
jgi:hypothetical protein